MGTPGQEGIREVQRRLRAQQGAFMPKPRLPVIDEVDGDRAVPAHLRPPTPSARSPGSKTQVPHLGAGRGRAGADRWPTPSAAAASPTRRRAASSRSWPPSDEREGRIDLGRLHDLDDGGGRGPTSSPCPEWARRRPRACSSSPWGGPRSPSTPTSTASRPGSAGSRRSTTAEQGAPAPRRRVVPPGIRYDLHLALITHGRAVCRAQRPHCGACILRDLCAYGSAAGNGRG